MSTLPTPHRRRWFRFSLRTLFVLVTLFGVWLGVQVNWMRDRKHALEWVDSINNRRIHVDDHDHDVIQLVLPAPAPWSIRILGADGVRDILIDDIRAKDSDNLDEMLPKLKQLFPEARSIDVNHWR